MIAEKISETSSLSMLDECMFVAVIQRGLVGKRSEATQKVEEAGFMLHRTSDCKEGCHQCCEFRRTIGWPQGIPLLKNPAAYQKELLHQLCNHYQLQLEDPPAERDPSAQGKF